MFSGPEACSLSGVDTAVINAEFLPSTSSSAGKNTVVSQGALGTRQKRQRTTQRPLNSALPMPTTHMAAKHLLC
jgi:hypothetical protein